MIRVAIIGASGYTGAESIEILLRHSHAKLTYATALPEECGQIEDVFGQFKGRCDMAIEPLDMDKLVKVADVALCCLPHKVSMGFVPKLLAAGLKVIDFSADYRIKDASLYEKYYKTPHTDLANLKHAVYGLPELFREQVKKAKLIANPGCFPTSSTLALAPLLKHGLVETKGIIVNSVTGSSGAGKNPSANFHFPNMNENFFPYGIGVHRHMPEMEQLASEVCGSKVELLFQPHVGPLDRGILSTVYCRPKHGITNDDLAELYKNFYKNERFVRVLSAAPMLKHVAHTNYCHLYATIAKGLVVCFAAIDNLVKGAAGQAIQNMNLMYGIDEAMGLE
jgi:N-acetyl-gamma-glutamyl-phosphate reductase